jgi:hypothetical protein
MISASPEPIAPDTMWVVFSWLYGIPMLSITA